MNITAYDFLNHFNDNIVFQTEMFNGFKRVIDGLYKFKKKNKLAIPNVGVQVRHHRDQVLQSEVEKLKKHERKYREAIKLAETYKMMADELAVELTNKQIMEEKYEKEILNNTQLVEKSKEEYQQLIKLRQELHDELKTQRDQNLLEITAELYKSTGLEEENLRLRNKLLEQNISAKNLKYQIMNKFQQLSKMACNNCKFTTDQAQQYAWTMTTNFVEKNFFICETGLDDEQDFSQITQARFNTLSVVEIKQNQLNDFQKMKKRFDDERIPDSRDLLERTAIIKPNPTVIYDEFEFE